MKHDNTLLKNIIRKIDVNDCIGNQDLAMEIAKTYAEQLNKPRVIQQSAQLKAFLEELTMPDTRNFLYVQNKAMELLKAFNYV